MKPYYDDGQITIFHARCEDVLPTLPTGSVDLVFTSPPYNLGEGMEDKGGFRVGHAGSRWPRSELRYGYADYDDALPYPEYVAWQQDVLQACWRVLSPTGAIYYNHKPRVVRGELRMPLALNPNLPLRQIVIWDRGSGFNFSASAYMPQHEWVMVMARPAFRLRDKGASGVGDVWRIRPDDTPDHPASFPLGLPARAIETAAPSLVLDPFAGIGTTLRAAKNADVKAIGIERNERYCELAVRRLSQEVMQFDEVMV